MSKGIEFVNITKRYGTDSSAPLVVKGVSFEVEQGSLTTILGPSGCGKTTLLRMIAGLESCTSGQIIMNGKDVTTLGPAERNVSMMFQSYALFPHMSVIENVQYGLKMSGVAKDSAHSRAAEALKNVGLVGYNERLPSELSGGQQQRVAIARALVNQPSLILADEPTGALDTQTSEDIMRLLTSLNRSGLTVVLVTHENDIAQWARRKIVFRDGAIVQDQASCPFDQWAQAESASRLGTPDSVGAHTLSPHASITP